LIFFVGWVAIFVMIGVYAFVRRYALGN